MIKDEIKALAKQAGGTAYVNRHYPGETAVAFGPIALTEFVRLAQERKPETCVWTPMDDDYMPGSWDSACGEAWSFIEGGPDENRVRFCQGCGKPVEIKESNQ